MWMYVVFDMTLFGLRMAFEETNVGSKYEHVVIFLLLLHPYQILVCF